MNMLNSELKSSYQSFELIESSWDTEYFGVRSAKVSLSEIVPEAERETIKRFCSLFEFVTITNISNLPENNFWLATETNAFQTDINVQFIKNLPRMHLKETFLTEVFEAYPKNEQIIEIASKAFKHSRFLNDPWLPPKKAKNLYVHWVENAFAKTGRFFVIAKNHGELVGFLLYSMDLTALTARIELIAIDEIHRGNSVGRSLIATMESTIKQKGIGLIQVGTQLSNMSAFGFYTSCGFKLARCNSVYHYWPFK